MWLVAAVLLLGSASAAANTAPTASAVSALTTPQTETIVTLSATDADSDTLTYIVATLPAKGTLSVSGTAIATGDLPYSIPGNGSTVAYTSTADTHGAITFTYKANDGTVDSAAATVTVTVNRAPTAAGSTVALLPDVETKITLVGLDADSDTLAYTILTLPGHGTLTESNTTLTAASLPYNLASGKKDVTYTPDPSFVGPDSFTYTARDTWESSDAGTVTLTINTAPTAGTLSLYAEPATAATISLPGGDTDRDKITYTILSLPAHGTLRTGGQAIGESSLPYTLPAYGSTVEYTSQADYLGTDSFHYDVSDGSASSALGIVTIIMNAIPVGADVKATTTTAGRADITLAPADADGDAVEIAFPALPMHGTVTIDGTKVTDTTKTFAVPSFGLAVAYQVAYDYSGTDSFQYSATDGKATAGPYTVAVSIPIPVDAPEPPSTDTSTDGSTTETTNPEVDPCGDMSAPILGAMMLSIGALRLTGGGVHFRNRRTRNRV